MDGKPCLYRQHPNHIESVYTFSSKLEPAADSQAEEVEAKPKCDNCQKQKASGVLSKGQIHLTSALLKVATDPDKPDLDCLEPEEVNQFLKRNLTWRVVDVSSRLFPHPRPPPSPSPPPSPLPKFVVYGIRKWGLTKALVLFRTLAMRSTSSNDCHGQRSLLWKVWPITMGIAAVYRSITIIAFCRIPARESQAAWVRNRLWTIELGVHPIIRPEITSSSSISPRLLDILRPILSVMVTFSHFDREGGLCQVFLFRSRSFFQPLSLRFVRGNPFFFFSTLHKWNWRECRNLPLLNALKNSFLMPRISSWV